MLNPIAWLIEFLQPKFVGLALGVAGAVGGIANAFGDSGGGGSDVWHWNPGMSGMGAADTAWRNANALNQQYSGALGNQVGTDALALYNRGMATDWQPYLNASQQAGDMMSGLSPLATQYGDRLSGLGDAAVLQGGRMFDAGNLMWDRALDPQNALRDRMMHDISQRSRAGSTARGYGMSPYAGGLESQALSNFDIDWENNMLNRLGMGMQGLSTGTQGGLQANQMAGQDWTSALGLYQLAPQFMQQGASMPLQARQAMQDYQQKLLGNYGQNIMQYQIAPQGNLQQLQIPYLYNGAGAINSTYGAFANDRAFNAQQQAAGTNALMQGIGQINDAWNTGSFGQAFGGGGGGSDFSGSNLSNAFSSATPSQWGAAFGY